MRAKWIGLIIFTMLGMVITCYGDEPQENTITPSVYPVVKNGCNVYVDIEFMYATAIQDNLYYAQTGVALAPNTSVSSSGSLKRVSFPWRPGFRVGLGAFVGHDGWDIYAGYSYLHSSSTNRSKSSGGNISPIGLFLFSNSSIDAAGITSARSKWDLNFNAVNLELGRNFYVSRFLAIRPFAGLKLTWQNQDWNNRYTANQITIADTTLPGTARSNQEQDIWGIGIRMGGNGTWYVYRSLSICSKLAFSAMWLDYTNRRKDRFMQENNPAVVITNLKKNTDTIRAVIELFLGLRGEWSMHDERYRMALQGGFDEELWINLSEFISSFPNSNGDFSITGFTLKARLDF